MRQQLRFLLMVLFLAAWISPALAGVSPERRFLICQASGVTTTEDAKPYIDGFGKYLAGRLGWAAETYEVRFETGDCLKLLETWKPSYATIPLWDFLAAEKRLNLEPLVFAKVGSKTSTIYRVMVKKGAFASIDALKGKTLTGNMVADAVYLSKVVFKGAVDAASHFVLKQKSRPLRAIRNVARDKADAALVDSLQFDSLSELAVFGKLEVIFTSEPVPNLGLVYVKGAARDGDVATFREALIHMCADPDGKEICKTFGLEGFVGVDVKALDAVRSLYGAGR
ncbi:MAG: PhnD/SsuA/transferrin family substrate-binding protein [Pseudomonadota bacterium]